MVVCFRADGQVWMSVLLPNLLNYPQLLAKKPLAHKVHIISASDEYLS